MSSCWVMSLSRLASSLLVSVLLLAGCESREHGTTSSSQAFRSGLGVVPPSPQPPGDPVAGYDAVINKPYITCGLPYSVYKKTAPATASVDLLPGRTGRNAELPYRLTSYTTPDGVDLVVGNCLACHAAHFNGELVVGLGNESVDFTQDRSQAVESSGVHVTGEAEAREWRKWADRIEAIAPYTVTDTVGSNPAINITWALFAHRDPRTLRWSQTPLLEPPSKVVLPVSTPPWWRMRKKNSMFYVGAGRGDEAHLMFIATSLCTDTVDEARQLIDQYARDIRAYIASLKPPVYPFPIDHGLAEQGRPIFEAHCSRCHGTYGEPFTYPNLVVGLDEVGTDPALAQAGVSSEQERFLQWFATSVYGDSAQLKPALGYVAPPLDGVWATAPYLHNGSIPSIEVLLNSSKRPKYWTRTFDSKDYNPEELGWNYTEVPYGKEGAKSKEERKRLYDTTMLGHSNQGHTFGDVLSNEERRAVIEYLKTL
jgi:mono/diheme cytochrome c family protein